MPGRGLPFELFLGLKYLRARGQRSNLSLFVWIGIGGVFLGCLLYTSPSPRDS